MICFSILLVFGNVLYAEVHGDEIRRGHARHTSILLKSLSSSVLILPFTHEYILAFLEDPPPADVGSTATHSKAKSGWTDGPDPT